jgi:hypothetical protein
MKIFRCGCSRACALQGCCLLSHRLWRVHAVSTHEDAWIPPIATCRAMSLSWAGNAVLGHPVRDPQLLPDWREGHTCSIIPDQLLVSSSNPHSGLRIPMVKHQAPRNKLAATPCPVASCVGCYVLWVVNKLPVNLPCWYCFYRMISLTSGQGGDEISCTLPVAPWPGDSTARG